MSFQLVFQLYISGMIFLFINCLRFIPIRYSFQTWVRTKYGRGHNRKSRLQMKIVSKQTFSDIDYNCRQEIGWFLGFLGKLKTVLGQRLSIKVEFS